MKLEITQPNLFTDLVPFVLVEALLQNHFLFRIQCGDVFPKLCGDANRHRARSHALSGLLTSCRDIATLKVNIKYS